MGHRTNASDTGAPCRGCLLGNCTTARLSLIDPTRQIESQPQQPSLSTPQERHHRMTKALGDTVVKQNRPSLQMACK
jgi:hypothetical protein